MSQLSDKHPIEGLMASALNGLKEMIDVNTIVGSPITSPDGTIILPVSKVGMGFGVGGSEYPRNKKLYNGVDEDAYNLFGGGTGGGMSLTPVGFLVVGNGTIRMISVSEENSMYDRIFDAIPIAIDKISELIIKSKNKGNVVADDEDLFEDEVSETDFHGAGDLG